MEDQSGDTFDPVLPRTMADAETPGRPSGEFEFRLRSTERIRMVVRHSCLPRKAPRGLVVRIRESLIVFKG